MVLCHVDFVYSAPTVLGSLTRRARDLALHYVFSPRNAIELFWRTRGTGVTTALDIPSFIAVCGRELILHSTCCNPYATKHRPSARRTAIYGSNCVGIIFVSRREEPTKPGTCARGRRALQQRAPNVHVEHSDLTCGIVSQRIFVTSVY